MILVETCMLPDYIGQDELVCQDPYLRNIEKSLFEIVRHADEIGDDIVVDPYFRIPWEIEIGDYGVPIEAHHAISSDGSDLGYSFNFGVQSEADADKLHLRENRLDRAVEPPAARAACRTSSATSCRCAWAATIRSTRTRATGPGWATSSAA